MWPFKRKPKPPKHKHRWYYVSVVHGKNYDGPLTSVSRVCVECRTADSSLWTGYWTLETLNYDWSKGPPSS